nr:MAG TPA: hypothetical protein [Caudoviricetes sp.]
MYLCTTKELRDGLSHQRKKFELGIEPNPNLPRKLRSGLSPNMFLCGDMKGNFICDYRHK